ncbi:MAG: sigma 54-interacting transcriptional regulator [Candidatus Binatia bacterium]|nr:sigma 54-interacting transcriptional regulator [Candidatus Binatia bacterium]
MAGRDTQLDKVRPTIRASWLRAQRLGVDPYLRAIPRLLSAEELERLQERADLIYVAAPMFETLVRAWDKERFMIGLSDRHGYILHVNGHPWVLQRAREINAMPGGGMAEELVGTTMVSVVLAQGRPDYVLWSENYCQAFHPWASLGAPVRHPITGEVIGVLGISGYGRIEVHADMVVRLADRLEQLLHHEELLRRVALLDEYHRFLLEHPHDTVFAIDGRGHICGISPSASELLASPHRLLGRSVLRVPDLRVQGFRSLVQQDEVRPYPVHVDVAEKASSLQAVAIPVQGQRQPVGTLLVLSRPRTVQRTRPTAGWQARYTFADLVGRAPAFQNCLALAQRAAGHDFPVLLLGESGTGKELLAHAIHAASPRRYGPFVVVNCGASTEELLAAELFGYVEGAFTGAARGGRAGKIELAHGGTLFLDEVEAMPPRMQVSLLRVLEDGVVVRVGAERPLTLDVRIVAASNEDLQRAVAQQRFRLDLYHRLSVFPILLPPLRDRTEDIPLLARTLLDHLGFSHLQVSPEALTLLCRYSWPGNVRELKHVLLRAAHAASGTVITPADLPPQFGAVPRQSAEPSGSLKEAEVALIRRTLAETGGNLTQAAARLGIHRVTLYRKMKRYRLS